MSYGNRYGPDSSYEESFVPEPEGNTLSRLVWVFILAGALLLLVWAGLKAWRVYHAAQSLIAAQNQAETLLAGGLSGLDPDAAEALVTGVRRDVVTLKQELGFLTALGPSFGRLPRVGPLAVASPHLLEMADAGTEAAELAFNSLKPALPVLEGGFQMNELGEVLDALAAAGPQLEAAGSALSRYAAARADLAAAVPAEELPWRVRSLLEKSDAWLPLGQDALRLAPHLPALLGQNGPKRYLLLAQNEDEMRPTGGFITGVGLLTVEDGRIVDLTFEDANKVDNWADKPYDVPPQPLYEFMLSELFLFRDANFWPDYPTSARKAMELYSYGRDVPLPDGAIAIDQTFLKLLLEATGPVPIPGTSDTVGAGDVIRLLRQARDIQEGQEIRDWVRDRKAFLAAFASAILARVETDAGSIDPATFVRSMMTALETDHLQVFVNDDHVAQTLSELGWDGRLPAAPPGDFLMVVDANLGFNKSSVYITRAVDYRIVLANPAAPQADLTVTYTHSGPTTEEPCYQGVAEEYEEAANYLELADKCYWNYVRVYAPAGSQLVDSTEHVVPGETLFSGKTWQSKAQSIAETDGLATFANFMLVPLASTVSSRFQYVLPAAVVQASEGKQRYTLRYDHQAGMPPEMLRVSVLLPEGATLIEANPAPTRVAGNEVFFEFESDRDALIEVRYR